MNFGTNLDLPLKTVDRYFQHESKNSDELSTFHRQADDCS